MRSLARRMRSANAESGQTTEATRRTTGVSLWSSSTAGLMTLSATSVATLPVTTGADIASACQEVALTRAAVRSAIGVPLRNAKAATRAGRIVRSARRTIESVAKAAAGGPVVLPRWAGPDKSHCRAAFIHGSTGRPDFTSKRLILYGKSNLVRPRGLEPPRCYPLAPQASASTNSATAADEVKRAPNGGAFERRCPCNKSTRPSQGARRRRFQGFGARSLSARPAPLAPSP
jgi:hypothetical protein